MWYIGRCYVYKHSLYAFSTLQTSHDVGHEDPRTGEICWYALHLVFEMHQRKLSPCGPFFLSFCPSLSLFFFSSSFVFFFIFLSFSLYCFSPPSSYLAFSISSSSFSFYLTSAYRFVCIFFHLFPLSLPLLCLHAYTYSCGR